MYTQIHENEIYNGCIYDQHINSAANIAGSKIQQATITTRGTVVFASDGEVAASKAVQANDSRLHTQGSDSGTTANTYTVNTDYSAGDATTIVLMPDGAIRFNDTTNYLEYCNDYSTTKTWYRLIGLDEPDVIDLSTKHLILPMTYPNAAHGKSDGSIVWDPDIRQAYIYEDANTMYLPFGYSAFYRTTKTGADSNDPAHTEFELYHGAFLPDGMNLEVFVNGQLKTSFGAAPDYMVIDQRTISFFTPLNAADVIEMVVYADILFRNTQTGADAINNPTNTQFYIGLDTDDYSNAQLMVYVNGVLLQPTDYSVNGDVVTLINPIADTDVLDTIVVMKGITEGGTQNDITGVLSDTFRIGMLMHEWHETQTLLFGRSHSEDVGLRNNHGVIEWKDYGDTWKPISNITGGSVAVKHYEAFYGSEASDAPINKQFTVTGVNLPVDTNQIQVFVNGRLLSYGKGAWTKLNDTTIELTDYVANSDIVDIYLYELG